jgi:hypothetical protein
MKFFTLALFLFIIIACNKSYHVQLSLENPSDFERQHELIVISADSLPGYLKKDNLLLSVESDSITLPSQCDDIDNDGKWDELAFLIHFKSREKITVKIKSITTSETPQFEALTNLNFDRAGYEYNEVDEATGLKGYIAKADLQFKGPSWENDKVAFRNYFDERNGIDVLGKTTSKMILDSIGIDGKYDSIRPWGMDILSVENSLGAGSLALMYKDSLYRLTSLGEATYTKVTEGPVRSIFDIDYDKITINGVRIKLKHRISIVAGEYGYRSTVITDNTDNNLFLVTGLVNWHSNTLYFDASDKNEIMFTHDFQSKNKDRLGLGIITNLNNYKGSFEIPATGNKIVSTNCIKLRTSTDSNAEFRVYAGWQLTEPAFTYRQYFRNYLLNEAYKMDQPVILSF